MPMRGKRLESAPAPLLASTSSALVIDERDLDGRFFVRRWLSLRRRRGCDRMCDQHAAWRGRRPAKEVPNNWCRVEHVVFLREGQPVQERAFEIHFLMQIHLFHYVEDAVGV